MLGKNNNIHLSDFYKNQSEPSNNNDFFLFQLYQLDLRLREVTQRVDHLFGNVSLFCFGDVCQLKPVMGKYIWSAPRSEEYLQAFTVDSHWEKFTVVSLIENHRQNEDK